MTGTPIITDVINDQIDALLITPERLANEDFRQSTLMRSQIVSVCSLWTRRIVFPTGAMTFGLITGA